jgi:hypothetical protein
MKGPLCLGYLGLVALSALSACGGPPSKSAADVDDDSNPKPADTAGASTDDGGAASASAGPANSAPAPGSADDSSGGPKKDECSVFDEANLEGVLLKSACESAAPTGAPPDTSKTLAVTVAVMPPHVAPGAHADVIVTFMNKSAAPMPLYFTIDPMPRFEIEVTNAKGTRVDLPKNQPPPLPPGAAPREPGTARIVLQANGTARMPLGWDAVRTRWAPERLKGTPPEKGYPRAPAGSLGKGKYTLKVVTPLTNVFEGIDHEVSQPRTDIVVGK